MGYRTRPRDAEWNFDYSRSNYRFTITLFWAIRRSSLLAIREYFISNTLQGESGDKENIKPALRVHFLGGPHHSALYPSPLLKRFLRFNG